MPLVQRTVSIRLAMLAGLCLVSWGCNSSQPPAVQPVAAPTTPTPTPDERKTPDPEPAKPDYASLLDTADRQINASELDEADKTLSAVREAKGDLSSELAQRLANAEEALQAARDKSASEHLEELLAAAKTALADGELEDATSALERVLAAAPTAEQAESAGQLKETIEDRRRQQRELRSALKLLSSDKRADVKAARTQLWEKADAALPLLLKSLQSDDPKLVENAMETLRMFNQPQRTLPAMVAVLGRAEQQASWPAAIKEIEKAAHPGAGEPLLKLALAAEAAEQQMAALNALSVVIDPPAETIVALLPLVYQDGPALAAALTAIQRAMALHKQTDLEARRGFNGELSDEQAQQLTDLPARLQAIITAGPADSPSARAAQNLAVATRQVAPQALKGVKVSRVVGDDPAGSPAAVLDGIWEDVDPKTMWRHPIDKPASIVLDLGEERTVTAVRIWNYNESGISYRGWKEVEIFVSPTAALLSPVAEGLIPKAPGAAALADYSVTIQVPFVRGRYIKLQHRSIWQPDGPSGLAEIEVLGF